MFLIVIFDRIWGLPPENTRSGSVTALFALLYFFMCARTEDQLYIAILMRYLLNVYTPTTILLSGSWKILCTTGNGFNKNVFSRFVYTMLVQAYSAYHISINHTQCMHEEQPGKAAFSENL